MILDMFLLITDIHIPPLTQTIQDIINEFSSFQQLKQLRQNKKVKPKSQYLVSREYASPAFAWVKQ